MARMVVTLDGTTDAGGTPLLMHSDRLADPLNPFSLEIGKITSKRKKTEADHLELALVEFMGCMYNDATDEWLTKRPGVTKSAFFPTVVGPPMNVPYLAGSHVVRAIKAGATRHKLGRDIDRGLKAVTLKCPVKYDGPTDILQLWKDGRFAYRKPVGIGSSKTMRTRPMFTDWKVEVEIEVDLALLNPEKIEQIVAEAGRYEGVGDFRRDFGRFYGTAVLVTDIEKATNGKVAV